MNRLHWMGAAAAAALLAGCATQPAPAPKAEPAKPAAAPAPAPAAAAPAAAPAASAQAREFYVVLPEDGRYYAFGSFKLYQDYLAHGEVPLTRTRIGAGPGGRTVVFAITNDDVKSGQPSQPEQVFDGKLAAAPGFYGEVFKDGRYYVFGELKDLLDFAAFGEVPYSFTDIGAGPNGATIVWVMNKDSFAKGRPAERIERFRQQRQQGK
ncbi:hypothetical protein Talka_00289 [Tepidimonas alkaliphilus]|uniref:Lipoprotein n=1 Tax=Tepidimonas alkaliphilus TaxID=2588942 RepID=A0A554WDF4_9BURK|nr:hypothetical protein [Tepidimonas alkaliphilus]TSE21613.1 hypothetical protein Talka_00289 [Tepidimonas alkaliphilus]